jgi:hypothetical protein
MRWLLVQGAVSILRLRHPRTLAPRVGPPASTHPEGKRLPSSRLARRLAGLLYAMLRNGTTYTPRVAPCHAVETAVPT